MRRAFKTTGRVTFTSVAVALGLLLVSTVASADTCIFDPNESGAVIEQEAGENYLMLTLEDSDCWAKGFAPAAMSEAGLNSFLGLVLAAKAMNKTLELRYHYLVIEPILDSIMMIEP